MIRIMLRKYALAALCLHLNACAIVATIGGGSAATIQAAQTIDAAKLGADAVSGAATGKTITDHAISYFVNQDCTLFNVFESKPVCVEFGAQEEQPKERVANQDPPPVPVVSIDPLSLKRSDQ
jgi:hypothetical protein